MKDYIILTDSCSDLGADLRKKYNIEYVQMHITFDNKELPATLDWDVYSPKELYDWMRNGKVIKTTQVPQGDYVDFFTKAAKEGKDVLYIACSSALSGSYNTSVVVKEMVKEDYPDVNIYCVDSLNSCLGEGSLVVKAAEMKEEGKTIEEVYNWLEENKLKVNQLVTVETLDYLKRAGRVKASSAFFGNLFGVKPILISDAIGQNYAIKKVKGRINSINELINMAKETIENPEDQVVYICHADCEDVALKLKERLMQEFNFKNVYVNYIGPIIGASAGPGTVGFYIFGKKVEVIGE